MKKFFLKSGSKENRQNGLPGELDKFKLDLVLSLPIY